MLQLPTDDWKTKENILLGLTERSLEDVLKKITRPEVKEKVAIRARAADSKPDTSMALKKAGGVFAFLAGLLGNYTVGHLMCQTLFLQLPHGRY
jgi:hypothetical protein